jgi:hypothetical protein
MIDDDNDNNNNNNNNKNNNSDNSVIKLFYYINGWVYFIELKSKCILTLCGVGQGPSFSFRRDQNHDDQ